MKSTSLNARKICIYWQTVEAAETIKEWFLKAHFELQLLLN
jgi:hypothetical protein